MTDPELIEKAVQLPWQRTRSGQAAISIKVYTGLSQEQLDLAKALSKKRWIQPGNSSSGPVLLVTDAPLLEAIDKATGVQHNMGGTSSTETMIAGQKPSGQDLVDRGNAREGRSDL